MKPLEHVRVDSVKEAVAELRRFGGAARLVAGGTDVLGGLRDRIWERPEALVDLKPVAALRGVQAKKSGLRIGALTTLTEVAESEAVRALLPALAEAARRTASPLLRNMGTLGGNLCQENRCWYYRFPDSMGGRIDCVRKGGARCWALKGDHRYHSIFGAVKKCVAVNPSDTAPALIALGAELRTTARTLAAADFFSAENGARSTVLAGDELLTEIFVPAPKAGTGQAFRKLALRRSIDFAIVSCAAAVTVRRGRIAAATVCLNGVHPVPYRVPGTEETLVGMPFEPDVLEAAADAAVSRAKPMPMNRYKVPMARSAVADTLAACAAP